jgi:hypothetical protein
VKNANKLVSEMFKVDIIGIQPVMADESSTGFGNAATTQAQKDYTLALAAISQMARESGGVSNVLNQLASDIADGTMSAESATAFQSALTAFFSSPLNLTGVNDIRTTNLANVGGTTKKVRLVTAGSIDTINGIIVTVILPPGVTLKANFKDTTQQAKPILEGVVTTSDVYRETVYIPATASLPGVLKLGLASGYGFSVGEFATIQCEVPPGVSVAATDFSIYKNTAEPEDPQNFEANANGTKIPDTDISVSVEELLPK